MKKCTKCWIEKELIDFGYSKKAKNWLKSECRKCGNKYSREYVKTKRWLITGIYRCQRASSRDRWHTVPKYTNLELQEWIFKQENFEELYDNWVESWYKKSLVPSVDRLDDYKWYSFDNIQLTTWDKNRKRIYQDMKNWINNKQSKAVVWIHKETWEKVEFHSIREASRQIWILMCNISQCCNWHKNYSHSWWYQWFFK